MYCLPVNLNKLIPAAVAITHLLQVKLLPKHFQLEDSVFQLHKSSMAIVYQSDLIPTHTLYKFGAVSHTESKSVSIGGHCPLELAAIK